MTGELVCVLWRDAWFDFDEPDPADVREDYLVTTVGWIVRENPRFLSIAQERLPHGDGWRAITHIPIAVIEHRDPIAEPSREASLNGHSRSPVAAPR